MYRSRRFRLCDQTGRSGQTAGTHLRVAEQSLKVPALSALEPVDLLLVDDRADGLLALEAVLAGPQYHLEKASSGAEALACLKKKEFAVILLDVQMPDMDGFETARRISQEPGSKGTPIIFVTAINKDVRYIHEGYETGAVDYLFKPFDPYILRSKVAVFAELYRKNSQIRHQSDEILRLHNDLVHRATLLEAANKELEAFSYSVSHDLRTPLRAIDGFSRELLVNAMTILGGREQDDLKRIRRAAGRMAQLIDDLLDLSRISRSDLRNEEVDLSAHVQKIMEDLNQAHPERRVHWNVTPHLTARGDVHLLHIALENLLNNAWKFTQQCPHPKIEFDKIHRDGRDLFFIRDNGAGFDMTYAGKLFGAFQRLHNADEFPGTGIGLATVQRIIQRHGGRIWAEAQENQGATFYFTLT